MKHVWILNHYAQEPGGAGGTRHFSLARNLRRTGWRASIIAASTDHSTGRQRLVGQQTATQCEIFDGVPFLWLPTAEYRGNGRDRMWNMLNFSWAALKDENLALLDPPDLIIGSSVHPFAAWAGLRLARRRRVPFVFEVRDLWPETLIDMGRLSRNNPISWILRGLEKHLYRSAQRTITLLPSSHEYIEKCGVPRRDIVWIPNGVDFESFNMTEARSTTNSFSLMYFGAHGSANGLNNLLNAMKIVENSTNGRGIELRLIGEGPLKSALVDRAKALKLTNVRFEDPVPKSAIPSLAAEADAFVFNLIDAPVFKYGISSNKLYDFMAAARPVLFCCASANNPIEEANSGFTVPPEDPRALAEAILKLAAMPSERRAEMGLAGRRHLEANYDMRHLAKRLAMTMDEVLEEFRN